MAVPKLKLLTLEESSDLVGVNSSTILQYKDLGLLNVKKVEGRDLYDEEDLRLVFNSRIRDLAFGGQGRESTKDSSPGEKNKDTESKTTSSKNEDLPTLSSILEHEKKETINHNNKDTSPISGELEKDNVISFRAHIEPEDKSNSSIDLIELSRSLKQQLELIISERNWLRERVEKLEMQFERQQMISISESETLRMLAKSNEKKTSPWSFLLSWTNPKDK